ncbi:MAG TPA: cbb3-type cytochrome c oxidase N-terminal domain-containing protein [Kofleriaceae bacterium]|jgi:cytochrome c oxidase cbb3-type subunit 3
MSEPKILDHEYDGIQEYDNPLPGWWRLAFAASIGFAIAYVCYYHLLHFGSTAEERYRRDLAAWTEGKAKREAADAANVSEELIAQNAANPEIVAHGKGVFQTRCVSCHDEGGKGLIGPNLTDEYQIHGTTRMDIYHTVHDGAPGTPMLAWGEQLPDTDVVAVATFVTTLRGTNVPGKAPQGQHVGRLAP